MYEGLTKRLRTICPEDYNNPMDFAYGAQQAMCEAADAIEALSMKLHGDEAAIAGMKREIERMVVIDVDKDRAIDDLTRQRDLAYARLCEWCGVGCSMENRRAELCEIAAVGPEFLADDYTSPDWATCQPEPPKEET